MSSKNTRDSDTQSDDEQQQNQPDILLNIFVINKKRFRILLNCDTIIWEREDNGMGKTEISVSDIIAINASCKQRRSSPIISCIPNDSTDTGASGTQEHRYLTIHYVRRVINSPTDCNTLRKSIVTLYSSDSRVIAQWHRALTRLLNEQSRPKHILMFINPFGGRKQGLLTYEKYCKPLFALAGIDASCVISQRPNQIRDIIMTQSLDVYDAVCCVGGDGTFAEVANGLIYRAMKDAGLNPVRPEYVPKPKMPIGVIPAGSTDTIVYSMHGTSDARTAVLHIVLGQTRGLDMCSVCNANGLIKFCSSLLSYGYLGDVALESERHRWMGPNRYEYAGVKKFLSNRGYTGEVILFDGPPTATDDDEIAGDDEDNDDDVTAKSKCYANCRRCEDLDKKENEPPLNGEIFCYDDIVQMSKSIENDLNKTTTQTNADAGGGEVVESPSSSPPSPHSSWKSIKGKFFMVIGANVTCACARSPHGVSRFSHLGDGCIDVILVRHTNFANNVRLLVNMTGPRGDIRQLPFVEIYRTRKFYFHAQRATDEISSLAGSCQPISVDVDHKTSQWNCDGEVIHDADVFMTSHCQLIDVFMRGPHAFHVDADADESRTRCCGCGR